MEYRVQVSTDFESTWLPTTAHLTDIQATGDWRYDTSTMDFISADDEVTTAGKSYDFTAVSLELDGAAMDRAVSGAAEVRAAYLEVPPSVSSNVRTLAAAVTGDAPTRFRKARALQQWFREDGGFSYDVNAAEDAADGDLDSFLDASTGRVGYCEQFAASMAIMARIIGIPSRVAVGFLEPQAAGPNTWEFSSHDLHAWPELYFPGSGWVRFEPTPQDRARSVPSYTNAQLGVDPTAAPSAAAPTRAPDDFDRPSPSPEAGAAGGSNGSGGIGRELLTGLLVLLGALGLALLPRAARGWVRRRRWTSATTPAGVAEAAWAEVRASALDLGLGWGRLGHPPHAGPLPRGGVRRSGSGRRGAADPVARVRRRGRTGGGARAGAARAVRRAGALRPGGGGPGRRRGRRAARRRGAG